MSYYKKARNSTNFQTTTTDIDHTKCKRVPQNDFKCPIYFPSKATYSTSGVSMRAKVSFSLKQNSNLQYSTKNECLAFRCCHDKYSFLARNLCSTYSFSETGNTRHYCTNAADRKPIQIPFLLQKTIITDSHSWTQFVRGESQIYLLKHYAFLMRRHAFFSSISATNTTRSQNGLMAMKSIELNATVNKSDGREVGNTSLSDYLQNDIFTESWAEIESAKKSQVLSSNSSNSDSVHSDHFSNRKSDKLYHYSMTLPNTNKQVLFNDYSDGKTSRANTSIEIKFNEALKQTSSLLESLFNGTGSASTLQLMDFDKVMVQWSQFHKIVDSCGVLSKGANEASFNSGNTDRNEDLKKSASENCMMLLKALEDNYDAIYDSSLDSNSFINTIDVEHKKHSKLIPNAVSYNLALHSLAHSKEPYMAQMSYSILNRMLDRCQKYLDKMQTLSNSSSNTFFPPAPPEPTIITYNSVIHAIAKSQSRHAGYFAEIAFTRMEKWKQDCEIRQTSHQKKHIYHGVIPNVRTLACLIDSWANTSTTQRTSFTPERTNSILDMAIEKRRAYVKFVELLVQEKNVCDDSKSCERNLVMSENDCFVEEHVDKKQRTINLLQTSIQNSRISIEPFLRPNTVVFNSVLHSWAISGRGLQGAVRSHEILEQMERLSANSDLELPNAYYDATTSSVNLDQTSDTDSNLKPNVKSYTIVMNAWTHVSDKEMKSGELPAAKCEMILTKMEELVAENASIRPNVAAYTTCINAWARASHISDAAARAEHILNRMIDLYYPEKRGIEIAPLEGDLENACHDAPFNAAITAYARSSDTNGCHRAIAILDRLDASSVSPTVTTYNAVLDACAKHGKPDMALSILDRMREKSVSPNSWSYNTVLNSLARGRTLDSAERAWDFLRRWQLEQSACGPNFSPTEISYSTVINAFAQVSGGKDGGIHVARKAKEIYDDFIQRVEKGEIQREIDSYVSSSFLNCCANVNGPSTEKRDALIMAINAFEEQKKNTKIHGKLSHCTFGTMMKVCKNLTSDTREKNRLIESLFVQACNQGLLSCDALGQFLRFLSSHLSLKIILSQGGSVRDIPKSWYQNVPRKKWPKAPIH